MSLRLTDGGHLAKRADGTIVRYGPNGNPVDQLRPGDAGYTYWLGLLDSKNSPQRTRRTQSNE